MKQYFFGVDIGTVFSKVSFVDETNGKLKGKLMESLSGTEVDDYPHGLIPSAVLYNDELNPIAFGKEAIKRHNQGEGYLITEFKMKLGQRIWLDTKPNRFIDADTVYYVFLDYILKLLMDKLKISINDLDESVFVFTHPAEAENDTLLKGKILRFARDILKNQNVKVFAIDEASATTQYLDVNRSILSFRQKEILVIDSGGGTTDLCLATGKYSLLSKSPPLDVRFIDSIPIGGRDIDLVILNYLDLTILNNENFNIVDVRKAKENHTWDNGEGMIGDNNKWRIENRKLEELIQPLVDTIIGKIQKFVNTKSSEFDQIELIILAGGNSKLRPFENELKKVFDSSTVTKVPDIYSAVSQGAALYGRGISTIRWRLKYDVDLIFANGKRDTLWRKGSRISYQNTAKKRVLKFDESRSIELSLCGGQAESRQPLVHRYKKIPSYNAKVFLVFHIDGNGYLNCEVRDITNQFVYYEGVIRNFLFDLAPPEY